MEGVLSKDKATSIVMQICKNLNDVHLSEFQSQPNNGIWSQLSPSQIEFNYRGKEFLLETKASYIMTSFGSKYVLKLKIDGINPKQKYIMIYPYQVDGLFGSSLNVDKNIEMQLDALFSHLLRYAENLVDKTLGDNFFD